jgi:hypothetical protein
MQWQTIRSSRDRAFWLPIAGAALLIVALGAGVQLGAHRLIGDLQSLQASDPALAAAGAERGLRLFGWGVCTFTLVSAALLARYFELGFQEQRLPPSGWWSLGARRAMVGPGVRSLSRWGLGLSVLLALAGVGCLLAVHHLLEVLSAGVGA